MVGGQVAKMSMTQLNELLGRVLHEMGRQGLTIITKNDPEFKPWLPESYWRQLEVDKLNGEMALKAIRAAEDEYLANTSVADVLEEGIPKLFEPPKDSYWMKQSMSQVVRHSPQAVRTRHQGDAQPTYDYECYQCGLPITGGPHDWKDHGGRTRCDLALLDQETIDNEDYWTSHQPKPWHGEEEDS